MISNSTIITWTETWIDSDNCPPSRMTLKASMYTYIVQQLVDWLTAAISNCSLEYATSSCTSTHYIENHAHTYQHQIVKHILLSSSIIIIHVYRPPSGTSVPFPDELTNFIGSIIAHCNDVCLLWRPQRPGCQQFTCQQWLAVAARVIWTWFIHIRINSRKESSWCSCIQ